MTNEAARLEINTVRRGLDGWILLSTMALVSLGTLMIYSSSVNETLAQGSLLGVLERQGLFVFLGLCALAAGAIIPYRKLSDWATPMAAISIALLIAVLIPHLGTSTNGAQRWFSYHGFQFQPSEIAKVAVAIYFARWLSAKGSKIQSFSNCTAPFGLILALICGLILIQPDLGTALVIAVAMIITFFVAGARLDHLGVGMAAGFVVALLAIQVESYRNARIMVWLHPWKYASSVGFHTVHAIEALGAGGILGRGLGNSQQKYVLPFPSTDSIFAVTGEELGFVGTSIIVLLFLVLAWRGVRIARKAPDTFGKLLAIGITSTIVIQAFLNVAVITNSVPFTGVPLPFISYGGSSLMVCLFSIGILLNISRQSSIRLHNEVTDETPSQGPPKNENRRNRRKDRRPRLSGVGRRRVPAPIPVGARIIQVRGRGEPLPRYG